MMRLAYETFLVDTGLGGDVFCRSYKKLHILAEKCWFQHLWHLCHYLQVELVLDKSNHAQPVREGDKCLMDAIIEKGLFKGDDLVTIGICRKFKAAHMISCIVRCDGREVRQDMLNKEEGLSKRQFPKERPTARMLEIWNSAVSSIATETINGKMCLQKPLGKFL